MFVTLPGPVRKGLACSGDLGRFHERGSSSQPAASISSAHKWRAENIMGILWTPMCAQHFALHCCVAVRIAGHETYLKAVSVSGFANSWFNACKTCRLCHCMAFHWNHFETCWSFENLTDIKFDCWVVLESTCLQL